MGKERGSHSWRDTLTSRGSAGTRRDPQGSEIWENVPGIPPTPSTLESLKKPWAGPPPSKAPSSHVGLRGVRRRSRRKSAARQGGTLGVSRLDNEPRVRPTHSALGSRLRGPMEPAEVQGLILCTPGPSSNCAESRPSPTPSQGLFWQYGP